MISGFMMRKGGRQMVQENIEVDTEDKNYEDYSASEDQSGIMANEVA